MKRLMRMRATQHLRDLCAETEFNRAQLIQPFFVVESLKSDEPIAGLRGNVRLSTSSALRQIESDLKDGVTHFLLFPVPGEKRESKFDHAFERDLISQIKTQFGSNLCLWVDTCLCAYTTHGHCAVLDQKGIDLPTTLEELANSALAFAEAGADGISPSDMALCRGTLTRTGYSTAAMPNLNDSSKVFSSHYWDGIAPAGFADLDMASYRKLQKRTSAFS